MASEALSDRLCEPCKEGNKDVKARTLCYECHLLLCEPCSDYHQRLKITKDHNLVDLVHFIKKSTSRNELSTSKQKPSSVNEDELASDFLGNVTLTKDTVLYRGAQVAVECTSVRAEPKKRTTSKQLDTGRLKAEKYLEFSLRRPNDQRGLTVKGVLCVLERVIVVDTYYTLGITYVCNNTFATCGSGDTLYLWTVRGQTIVNEDVSYHVDHRADGIHYNGKYYCVLHRWDDAIAILDRQGIQVRKIIMKEACGKKIRFGWDIHMDSDTNNIYVPCENENGVMCMTLEGQSLWFTPLSGAPYGITEIHGTLCVADSASQCLHLITKDGEYVRKLLDKEDLEGKPKYVCHGQDGRLYVSLNDKELSVYTITA
ncbi:hypothetical protein FSP39_006817 [Pinctada imbricata]|uniref:B box-type domain-containing protein n=1 Tax=Pinctada imbricata TaxID=66713 RepID=A0AA89CDU3_PINIB|nr:hypothetical protein FSP39_006817 [Pinctada imbricata]